MDYEILSIAYKQLWSPISITILQCFFAACLFYTIWRLIICFLITANSPTSVQYVNFKRRSLQIYSSYNPFFFDANYATANYSGIECILKSEHACYVQAFWGVPIFPLFELLHGDWQSLINAILSHIRDEKFSSKCIYASDSFILSAGEEKSIEFKPCLNIVEITSQKAIHMREIYPFVVLMVLKKDEDVPQSSVVAVASAVHIPDQHLKLYPQLIGQYIKLSSGQVGQIKKIFLSSAVTSDDDGDKSDLCLACYHRPISMVFLPCRHACLCSVCFDQCERCPVCRAASPCYFELPDIYGNGH